MKVYRDDDIAITCIQNWLDVINEFDNPDIYIVCDSRYLKMEILHKCHFPDSGNLTFMRSRERAIKGICRNLHSKSIRWRNATYAHIIPFWHAKQNSIDHHWDLDADDTMFLLSSKETAIILKQAEKQAEEQGIEAYSLDMWRSRTKGRYWTFGVLYIRNNNRFYSFFENNHDKSWMKRYEDRQLERFYNIDWYFTYLKEEEMAKIETFYVENSMFAHLGANCLSNPIYGALYKWKNGVLHYPIIENFYGDDSLAANLITNCNKIDIGLKGDEQKEFLCNKFGRISDFERRRFGLLNHI